MSDDVKPFDRLSVDQQKVAIDLAVAASLIVTRLPSIGQEVFRLIERDYAAQYDVPANVAKYALRACGQTLFQTPWACTVTKDLENNVATRFRQEGPDVQSLPGGNGE